MCVAGINCHCYSTGLLGQAASAVKPAREPTQFPATRRVGGSYGKARHWRAKSGPPAGVADLG